MGLSLAELKVGCSNIILDVQVGIELRGTSDFLGL